MKVNTTISSVNTAFTDMIISPILNCLNISNTFSINKRHIINIMLTNLNKECLLSNEPTKPHPTGGGVDPDWLIRRLYVARNANLKNFTLEKTPGRHDLRAPIAQ